MHQFYFYLYFKFSLEGISIFDCEYEGGDVSSYMDSSLCLPDASVTSEDSNSPGMLSSDQGESVDEDSVSWMEDPSSGIVSCVIQTRYSNCRIIHVSAR